MATRVVSITRHGLVTGPARLPNSARALRARGRERPGPRHLKSATEALAELEAGNRRFVSGRLKHTHEAASWRKHLEAAQHPFATILTCSDSRVPPELIFNQGFGDLFVVRVAGNIIAPDVIGSLQYAVLHLHTTLVVIMGHESCGAVAAAIGASGGRSNEPRFIADLLASIEPGLEEVPADLEGVDRVHAAVEANVRWSIRQLESLPDGTLTTDQSKCLFAGAVYDIVTGKVRFIA